MAKKAPSLEYLLALKSELEAQYQSQNTQITRMRAVRELTQPVILPDEYENIKVEVRDPTATDECFRVSAVLSVNPAKIRITPAKPSEASQAVSTLREKCAEAILRQAARKIPGQDTERAFKDAAVSDGGGWSKFLFTKDTWDERYSLKLDDFDDAKDYNEATEEAKKRGGAPFIWVSCDSLTIYPVWQGAKLGEILEVSERPTSSAFRQYRLAWDSEQNIVPEELGQPEAASDTPSKVTFLEHWDDTWVSYAIVGSNKSGSTGQVVKKWKHGLGRTPYFFTAGVMMNHWRNYKTGWSISESKRWLVEFRSFLWTMYAQVVARDAKPVMFMELPITAAPLLGADNKPIRRETWRPGEIIVGQPGEKLTDIKFGPAAQSLREAIASVSDAIAALETPRFKGEMGDLSGAGFAVNQVLTDNLLRYSALQENMERTYVEVVELLWMYITKKIQEPVWVYGNGWYKIGPEDLKEAMAIECHIDPALPSSKLIDVRVQHEMIQAGTTDIDSAIDALGGNPDEVRLGKAMDRIRQSPWYQQYQDQQVLQFMGRGDLQKAAQQIAQTGVVPGVEGMMGGMGTQMTPDMAAAPTVGGQLAAEGGAVSGAVRGGSPGLVVPERSASPGAALQ